MEVKQTCLTGFVSVMLWVGILKTKYTERPHTARASCFSNPSTLPAFTEASQNLQLTCGA